ncbi:subtilisin-like protease SBT5.4 [Beta vulgaris subsp. vulgaris]|uniref:subtilisin-like protease SBT5.4 n=1 Tax=Beta vulgaris subsp. vulgaris TaxID=3555 RepID=UPI002547259E|nr:subtilisin-like protease SBT5.4 [Beta vulgaris subsp. vulgaris]
MFADDLLLFARADMSSVVKIMNVLQAFSQASGLSASIEKNSIYVAGVSQAKAANLGDIVQLPVGVLPFKYLGVPLTSRKLNFAQCAVNPSNKALVAWAQFYKPKKARGWNMIHYIIYLGSHHAEPRLSSSSEIITNSHHELISSVLRSDSNPSERMIYSYNKIFNGFAATLNEEEANELAKHPNVASIFENRNLKMATTQSLDFLGLHYPPKEAPESKDSIWEKANYGDGMIIANIDSGVWPESESFSDKSFGPIPKKFKGACANEHDPAFKCNKKLIGGRYFYKGVMIQAKSMNVSFNDTLSPRDDINGHGTHTLSTAGGNFVPGVSCHGLANGTAKGTAPKSRVAAYKIIWKSLVPDEKAITSEMDMLAAFEAAMDDGVDIINLSMGPNEFVEYTKDAVAISTFHAMKNDILVVASASNTGPSPQTVENTAPWVLTVAASTVDREISSYIILGNHLKIKTAMDTIDSVYARQLGAAGLILASDEKLDHAFYRAKNPTASFTTTNTSLGTKPAPIMGCFSSRGPSKLSPGILKVPDITAPGVDILAAFPPNKYKTPYFMTSGTSMAAPHVAGIAALIKKIHPDWTTAAIKSAIMTTASPLDNTGMPIRDCDNASAATPFAYGTGHVRPNLAMDPGLIYNLNQYDYLNFLCTFPHNNTILEKFSKQHSYKCPRSFNILDFNYPSISIPNFTGKAIVTRELTNVGQPGTYIPRIEAPTGVSIVVEPKIWCSQKG